MKHQPTSKGKEQLQDGQPAGEEKYKRGKQSGLVRFGKRIRDPVNAWFAKQSLIGDDPVLDPSGLQELDELAENWTIVRDELVALLKGQTDIPAFGKISPDHRRIANSHHWKSFFFGGYGFRMEHNCELCPQTSAMLDRIPFLVVAFFSIMEPGTHVPRHRGLTKAWLNCHLPLIVPRSEGRCEMQVAGETMRWREGEWLVFDETNPHEVWNATEDARVVLFLQVRRPMTRRGNWAARTIYEMIRRTSFVQDLRRAVS